MKRILSCLLAALFLLPCIPMSASAAAMSWKDIRPYINSDEMGDLGGMLSINLDFKYDSTKSYQRKIQLLFIKAIAANNEELLLNPIDNQFDSYEHELIDYSSSNIEDLLRIFGAEYERFDEEFFHMGSIDGHEIYAVQQLDITFTGSIGRQELVSVANELTKNKDCWNYLFKLWRPGSGNEFSLDNHIVYASLVEDGPIYPETPPYRDIVDVTKVDWDAVRDDVIWIEKSYFPVYYRWSIDDFPELELAHVKNTDFYSILHLKNPGKEHIIDAVEKLALRKDTHIVQLCKKNVNPDLFYLRNAIWNDVQRMYICLEPDENRIPADYEWTAEDFPGLDVLNLHDYVSFRHYIEVTLKTRDQASITDAYMKLIERPEFIRVSLGYTDFAPNTDPVTEPDTEPTSDPVTTPTTDTAAPTDPVDETTVAPEAGANRAPQTGDTMAFIACIVAADFLIAAAIVIFRKRRSA